MNTHSTHQLLYSALAVLVCQTPSLLEAQTSGARSTAPTPVLTLTHPSEGQVISGDLEIAVAVQEGSVTRRYATEAAYWDARSGGWVYPGLLGTEFAGQAPARIAADRRIKLGGAATRWRIRVHSMEPPGSWGPWREFVWHGIPGQANSSGAAVASTPAPGVNAPVAVAIPPSAKAEDTAALLAQIDEAIAAYNKQIVLLNFKISQEKLKIDSLMADYSEANSLLSATKPARYRDTMSWFIAVKSLSTRMENDLNAIKASNDKIGMYKIEIQEIEKHILELQKQRAALLAK